MATPSNPLPRLPERVHRAVERGEIDDPMWYVGPLWPTVEDILDMTDDQAAELKESQGGS